MNIKELQNAVVELRVENHGPGGRMETQLEELFGLFLDAEEILKDYNQSSGGAEDDKRADWVIEIESEIMAKAAKIPSDTVKGALYKLAMWRWDAADIDVPEGDMLRSNAVAYSAFRDLARLLKEERVLSPRDRRSAAASSVTEQDQRRLA